MDVETGEVREVTQLDDRRRENNHRYPFFLPDGRRYLYVARADSGDHMVMLASLDDEENAMLVPAFSEVAYVAGHLLFVREGTLFAQRLDPDTATLGGDPIPIVEGVRYSVGTGDADFCVAGDGTLIYVRQGAPLVAAWFDRGGTELRSVPLPWSEGLLGMRQGIRVFGGSHYLTTLLDSATSSSDVYAFDEATGAQTRITSDPRWDEVPVWSHDGRSVLYRSGRTEQPGIYLRPLDGGAERFIVELAITEVGAFASSSNGRDLLVATPSGGLDLVDVNAPDRRSPWEEDAGQPAFSPDGTWVAYVAAVSGMPQVYFRSLEGEARERVATPCSASHPRWSASGDELFFACGEQIYAASISEDRHAGAPEALFSVPAASWLWSGFDVDEQGRFLGLRRDSGDATVATIVLNWLRLLDGSP